jgi:gliding motility-associated-like protein
LSEIIDITPVDTVFVPSAFTPNSDILNDDFKVVSYSQGIKIFEMKIYDRYGGLIFSSDNPLIGWNGLLKNGLIAMSDVYTYDIKYETFRKIKKRQNGYFTLLR